MTHPLICSCCGTPLNEMPLDIAAPVPDAWQSATQEKRDDGFLSSDVCYLETDQYLRVCIDIPILDHDRPFTFGVWVVVSPETMNEIRKLWTATIPDTEPSKDGVLATEIRDYPESLGLKGKIWLRNDNKRPLFEVTEATHPLAIAQAHGLSIEDAHRIVLRYMPHT